MRRMNPSDDAVSPVVGVMLMLVVTIIIAAVVSAFAGGLSQTTSKAPQLSIGAEVRNDSYILIDHNGGDPVSAGTISVRTFIPSGTYKDLSYKVDLSKAIDLASGEPLIGSYGTARTIQTGDKIRINWADAFAASSYGGYMAPAVGEPVSIEIYDLSTGKVIATAQTTVLP
jgi:FlaG/FlaF family flagellin (archaellin)